MATNWIEISTEYITTDISLRDLATKHNVSFNTIKARAKKESWTAKREEQHHSITTDVLQKTAVVVSCGITNRIERISSIADRLVDKLEQAVAELDDCMVTRKVKVKTIEYDPKQKGKVAKEIITEEEILDTVKMNISTNGVKQLTSALKDLRDIQIGTINNDDNGILDDVSKYLEVGKDV